MDIQDQPLQTQPSAPVVNAAPAQVAAAQAPVVAAPVSAPSPAQPSTEPTLQLNAIPTEEHQTAFRSHKSLIIGVILGAIVVVSGLSVFIGFNNSSSQYQGFLQKIEAETEKLNADKAPTEQDVPEDGFGANSATEIDANSKAALPELGEETLSQVDSTTSEVPAVSPAEGDPDATLLPSPTEDEGVAR